ncbi:MULTISPECIES: type IX secretion system outer membrane channel protein PorV [Salegentibacter]|uniref:Type IX secretion system outer membrane channel protein PorV n=1 Tax=Salegentibacter maritimus TaxID=2794347 RepID=A0ABS0TFE8_9FLAO|nr:MULTISPECIES: type IX secretion system outer membrane channel protein PorV [Salegentibacter]MBE7639602.1 type IX secretion system outer membrane channel protein PorV [Salegentibacter sp. BLCTC]MBI6115544.1 type IX secretion system outer membrane channel protein PorV [Salegentibacter maritimus]MBI6118764.1 type IX secretion system outer membrane channel protein PorV [Salegentibacter maritimus]
MKKITILILGVVLGSQFKMMAQEERDRVITTAVPFLQVAADARAAGMGDQGVATSADVFSQQWNPAKYAFSPSEHGVGVSYTPYLSDIVNDIFLGNITYYQRISERSAFGSSLRYFSLGSIERRSTIEQAPLVVNPNELTFDLSYSLKLSENIAMAVAGRYLHSNLGLQDEEDLGAANSFGVDIAAFYRSDQLTFSGFDGVWKAGANISNIGPKMKYDDAGQENFIPTNFKVGGGFDFIFDIENRLGAYVEFNKLLVPTPKDFNGDGEIDAEDDARYNDIGAIEGIFKSWGDAPDGFSEELREVTWALGAEYVYREAFAFRAGYFSESLTKGSRRFASFGAGFKYEQVNIDVSYLFSTSSVPSPLEGTLRFGLTFNFGDQYTAY